MKVMCIREANNSCPFTGRKPIVKVGGIYTVVLMEEDSTGEMCYELSEDMGYLYSINLFAPLSSIDEQN